VRRRVVIAGGIGREEERGGESFAANGGERIVVWKLYGGHDGMKGARIDKVIYDFKF
jgi:hypothetical protein